MALSDVGVIFVSKGFADFMKNMSKAASAITNMGNMTQNRLKALQLANDAMVKIAKSARDLAVSNDKVTISQQKSVQSANNVKKAQEQVKISANNAKTSYNNWQKSINDSAVALKKIDYNTLRLDEISKLNDALIQGALDFDTYTQAALATNNQLRMLGGSASKASTSVLDMTKSIGSSLGGLGGIFSSVTSFGNLGATIGVAIGSIFPVIGTTIGAVGGYIFGALAGIGAGILKWFIGLAASIGRAIINLGKKIIGWIGGVFNSILSTIKGFFGTIFNLLTGGIFQSGWNNLGNTIVSSMFKFEILKEAIRKVVQEINNLASEAKDGAIELQTFTARLNFLINSQVVMADSTIGVADAWAIASNEAQDLLGWIQKLSLSSPMLVEDISKTVSMAIAMGWGVDSAKKLTLSILDYTAAVGLGSEESERIIYNFAQMKNQGKVTGTELRDLGRGAFVPVNKVLEIMYEDLKKGADGMKYASMSFEEFRKQASSGQVDVEGFFTAFEEFVGTYMPNAMEKMNYTFKAVQNRIKNLFSTLLGWDVLGPVIVTITKPLDELVKRLSTDKVILSAKRLGIAIATMFTSMKAGFSAVFGAIKNVLGLTGMALPNIRQVVMAIVQFGMAIKKIGEGIAGLIEKIFTPFAVNIRNKYGSTFARMRDDFFSWGANLIVSFAKGMFMAASKVLIAVIKAITKLLTFWLKGSSPPRVAPDIDKWGAKTIDEYYGGFTNPDPAVVNKAKEDIADTTKDIVDSASKISMPNLNFGAISLSLHTFSQADFESLDAVQTSLKDILSTLATLGQITTEESGKMFASMSEDLINGWAEFNKTGKISLSIFDRLRSLGGVWGTELAELLDLQLQLAVAVENTAKAQKAYDDAVKASIRAETKVNKLVRDYNNLLRKGASRKTLKTQLKVVNASEMEYAIAKKAEETKKTELDLATERQKVLEDSVKLQESLIKQMTELVQAQKDAAGGASDLASAVDELGAAIGDIGFDVEPPWTDTDLQTWIKNAETNFNNLWPSITEGWNNAWKDAFGPTSPFQTELNNLSAVFQPAVDKLKGIWNEFADNVGLPSAEKILGIWNQPTRKTVTSYGPLKENAPQGASYNPATGQYETVTTANTFVDKFYQTIQAFQTEIQNHGGITQVLTKIASYILTKIGELMTTLANDTGVQTAISNGINALAGFMNTVLQGGETGPNTPLGKLSSGLSTLITNGLNFLLKTIGPGTPAWNTMVSIGSTIGQAIVEGLVDYISSKVPSWMIKAMGFGQITTGLATHNPGMIIEGAKGVIGPQNEQPPEGYQPGQYIGPYSLETYNAWDNFIQSLSPPPGALTDAFNFSIPVGTNIADGIGQGVTDQIPLLQFPGLPESMRTKLDDTFNSRSPSKEMYPVGNNLAEGIAQGLLEQIDVIKWIEKVQPLIDAVNNVFGIAQEGPSKIFDKIGQSLANGLADGIEWVLSISTIVGGEIYNSFEKVVSAANQALGLDNPTTSPFYVMGQDMVQGIIDGFEAMIPILISEWNSKVVARLPKEMQDKYEMWSPSRLFMGFGENIVEGLVLGLSDFSTVIEDLTAISPLKLAPTIPMSATVSAPPVYGGTSVTFGDTYINNDMDWAVFKSRVQRAMTER